MGLGGYSFCEMHSISKEDPLFRQAFRDLETKAIIKATDKWFPKLTPEEACGFLTPKSGEQFGRTTVLPELFDDHNGAQMNHWRQSFTTAGHQTLITGTRSGNVLPEDFLVAWLGLAFPNKQQHITEIKFEIGERKFGRLNLERMHADNNPILIFEEGLIINPEESFELTGYVEGPIPDQSPFITSIFQRIVMIGATYYKIIDKVLGNTGAAI